MRNLNDADFYYVNGSEQKGPVKLEELRLLKLPDTALIWFSDLPNWKALGELTDLKEQLTPKGPPSLDQDSLWKKSWDLQESGEYHAAIENWKIYVSIFPGDSAAHYNLGYCYCCIKQSDLELKHRSLAVELVQDSEKLIKFLSTKSAVHEEREEWHLARLDLSRALDTIQSLSRNQISKANLESDNEFNLKWRIARHHILCGDYRQAALFFLDEAESNFLVQNMWLKDRKGRGYHVEGALNRAVYQYCLDHKDVSNDILADGSVSYWNLALDDFQQTSLQFNKNLGATFHNLGIAFILKSNWKLAFKCLFYSLQLDDTYHTFLTLYFLLQHHQAIFDSDFFVEFLLDNKLDQLNEGSSLSRIEFTKLKWRSKHTLEIFGELLDYFDTPLDEENVSIDEQVKFTVLEGRYIRGIKWFISVCVLARKNPSKESIYWSKDEFDRLKNSFFLSERYQPFITPEGNVKDLNAKSTYTTERNNGVAGLYQDSSSNLALIDLQWSDSKKSIASEGYRELGKLKIPVLFPLFPFKAGPYSGFTTEASDVMGPMYPTGRNLLMFIDTETTGLPKNYDGSLRDFENWPRVIQAAWVITTLSGDIVSKSNFIVKPDGFSIPQSSTDVHGISNEEAEMHGHNLEEVLNHLSGDLNKSLFVIGHNIKYDSDVLAAEYLRRGQLNMMLGTHQLCTMKSTVNFCKISGMHGYKWPSLEELHYKLFKSSIENAHDALNDVMATKVCFFELVERGEMSFKSDVAL